MGISIISDVVVHTRYSNALCDVDGSAKGDNGAGAGIPCNGAMSPSRDRPSST